MKAWQTVSCRADNNVPGSDGQYISSTMDTVNRVSSAISALCDLAEMVATGLYNFGTDYVNWENKLPGWLFAS